jgi:hypothetical protein
VADHRSWAERRLTDAGLDAYVRAEVGRAGVDASALRAEVERERAVNAQLRQLLAQYRTSEDHKHEVDRVRQTRWRRRHGQHVPPLPAEAPQ